MPMLRKKDATEALIGLNNVQPYTSFQDDNASDIFLDGDTVVHYIDLTVAVHFVKVPMFDAEQLFGSSTAFSSTYTPSDVPSDETEEQLSDTLPGGCGTLCGKKRVPKINALPEIRKFFEICKDPKIQNMAFLSAL
jgi:hypothetical protein